MQNRFVVSLAVLASIAAAAPVFAQDATPAAAPAGSAGHTMEYGIDAGVRVNLGTPKVTIIGVPVQSFRVGYYLNDKVSLEPMVALSSVNDGSTVLAYSAALGLLWHFNSSPVGAGAYVRPFGGVEGVHVSGSTNSDGLAGVGLGFKHAMGDRMAGRVEGNYTYIFDSSIPSSNRSGIGLNLGLSFFTR